MSRVAGELRRERYPRSRRSPGSDWQGDSDELRDLSVPAPNRRPDSHTEVGRPGASHLRLIEMGSKPRFRPSPRMLFGLCVATATFVCLGLVYVHVVLAQRQFALDTTNARIAAQETTYQGLRLRVAELSSPANIIATAEGKLGMVQPSSVNYLTPTGADHPASTAAKGSAAAPAGPTSLTPGSDSDWPAVKSLIAGLP